MINWIREWLDGRRRDKVQALYQRGYEWAAAQLLQGTPANTVEMILDDLSLFSDNQDAFDHGAAAACRDWRKLRGVMA